MKDRLHEQILGDARERSGTGFFRAGVITALVFISLLAGWFLIVNWYRDQLLAEKRAQLSADVVHDGNALVSAISRRAIVLQSMAAFILSHHDESDMVEETNLASTWLHQNVPGVDYIAIAPGGVQHYVFPADGNADRQGVDLMHGQPPDIEAAINRAIDGRQVALGDLVQTQSGRGQITAYYPVYRGTELWGLVALGLDFQTILDEVRLGEGQPEIEIALRNDWGRILYGAEEVMTRAPVTYHLISLQHDWVLAAAPRLSWDALIREQLWPFEAAGLAVVSVLTLLTLVMAGQQSRLTRAVRQRTEELRHAYDDLEARVKQRTTELMQANAELHSEITVRRRVTQQLRESEALYRTLLIASPDAVTVTDRQGRITFASEKARTLFGYDDLAEIIGEPLISGVAESDHPSVQAALTRLFDGLTAVDTRQLLMRRGDGSTFIGEVDSALLLDADDQPAGIVSITRDITRRVEMEEELRRAHDELELRVKERTAALLETNEALQASEAKFRTIVEHSVDGITLVDESGVVLEWNRGQEQITGIPREAALGQYIWDVQARLGLPEQHSPERHEQVAAYSRALLRDGQLPKVDLSAERPILRPDGTQRIIQPLPSTIKTDNGYMIVSFIRDVTERKLSEEALRQSEIRFRTIADFTYDWEYWVGPDQSVIYMTPSCERVTGYQAEAFAADPELLINIIHPDDRHLMIEHTHQDTEPGEVVPIDFRLIRRDGTMRWIAHVCRPVFDEAGRALGRRVSNRDITERKRVEQALMEQERLYRSVFEATADGLAITTLDGLLVETNPAFCAMHGWDPADNNGRRILSFIHPAHRHVFASGVQAVRAGQTFEAQAVHLRRDDRPFYVETRAVGLVYYGQTHVLNVVRDVSAQVEAYMRLEQRVQERTHELSMLLEFSHTMTRTLETKPLLRLILNQLRSVVEYTGATILSLSGRDLIVTAHQGPIPESESRQLHFTMDSPLGQVILARPQPVIIADVLGPSSLARAFRETLGDLLSGTLSYIRSWLGVPLVLSDQIVGMLAVSHTQPNYFTQRRADLAMAFANQAILALENARLYEQAQDLATMQERQRLARDLHDSVSQTLFSASLAAQVLPRLWTRHPDEGQQCLNELSRLTRGALAEMRTLLVELRPNVLVETRLSDLLRQLAEAITSRTRVPVEVITDGDGSLPPDVQVAFYRIAQEALNNVAKHANAGQALVRLQYLTLTGDMAPATGQPAGAELSISDDGRGFVQSGISGDHLGLGIMRERAEAIDADFAVDSTPGCGTQIVVMWPKPQQAGNHDW